MSEIFDLCDRATDELAAADPIMATMAGIAGHDDRWTDLSPDGVAERRAQWEALRVEADGVEVDTPVDRLAKAVFVSELDRWVADADAGLHRRDLNSIASPTQDFRMLLDLMATETVEHWAAIAARLEGIEGALAGYRASLEAGLAAADIVAQRQVREVITQCRDTTSKHLFGSVVTRFDDNELDDADMRSRLEAGATAAEAAYGAFADWLEAEYLPHAPLEDAVGRDRYLASAQRWLGCSVDLEATYAWGWSEIDRLWNRIGELAPKVDPDATVDEVMFRLMNDPSMAAPDVESFIADMTERQHLALEKLAGVHFDVPEEIRAIDVKVDEAGGALAAHYTPPSEDFSRPGAVWYPIADREHLPMFTEVTTAYHEGFPGHHLQVGIQFCRADELSRFHRMMVWYPGSGEGWALYAEHVMGELGFLEKPEYEIGLVVSKLFRSCRIVIDIGMHCGFAIPDDQPFHPGESWDYDRALELLLTRGFLTEQEANSEVVRYFGWPGQAISYKIGEQALLDLREEAMATDRWDPKVWHDDVLAVGAVGLDLLRSQLREKW